MARHIRSKAKGLGAAALVAAVVVLGAGGTASALAPQPAAGGSGSYPVHTGSLSITNGGDTFRPGATIGVSGGGYAPGATVQLTLHSGVISLGTATADASGNFTAQVELPLGLAPGRHQIVATGPDASGGTLVQTRWITVTDGHGRMLARTGADASVAGTGAGLGSATLAGAGLGTAGLAGALVLAVRANRRRQGGTERS